MTTGTTAPPPIAARTSSGTSVAGCRVLDAQGTLLATGTALVERGDERTEAMVQARQPAGLLVLAIFGRGERCFMLELAGEAAEPVELVGSAWLAGGGRICRFRSTRPAARPASHG